MGEASNSVEDTPAASTPPQQPAIAAPVLPSAAPDVDNAKAPDSGNAAKTGTAAGDQNAPPTQGTGTAEADAAANATGTRADEEPAHGTNLSSPATPPKTPERSMAPSTRAGGHALGAETAPDVDTAKPDGCTTPVHDVEGSARRSADGHGSPLLHGEKPKPAGAIVKRDVAASKSRLLTFRSFSRHTKVNKPKDAAPPLSMEEPLRVHGKAGEDGAEHKEKGKERRKRFWK